MAWDNKSWPLLPAEQPAVKTIAEKYSKSPEQVILRWAWQAHGVVANPRTWDMAHMKQNLDIFDFTLTSEELSDVEASGTAPGAPKQECGEPATLSFMCVNKVCPNTKVIP